MLGTGCSGLAVPQELGTTGSRGQGAGRAAEHLRLPKIWPKPRAISCWLGAGANKRLGWHGHASESSVLQDGTRQGWGDPKTQPPSPGASIPTQQPPVGALSWPHPTRGVFTQYILFFSPVFVLTLLQAQRCPSCSELRALLAPSPFFRTPRGDPTWPRSCNSCTELPRWNNLAPFVGFTPLLELLLAAKPRRARLFWQEKRAAAGAGTVPALSQLCQGAAQSHRAPPGRRAKYVKSPDGGHEDYELQNLSRVLAKTQRLGPNAAGILAVCSVKPGSWSWFTPAPKPSLLQKLQGRLAKGCCAETCPIQ